MMICLLPMRLTRLGPEVLEMEQVYQEHHDRFNRSDQRLNNLIGKMKVRDAIVCQWQGECNCCVGAGRGGNEAVQSIFV